MVRIHDPALAGLRRRFDRWRRLRPRGARIPELLWRAAVRAAREHGVCRTSRRLGVDYYSLKSRLTAATPPSSAPMEFVEIPSKVLSAGPGCVVELQDRHGRRLRIELQDAAAAEALARALWRDRR